MKVENFDWNSLKAWFRVEKRDLPWRYCPDPYAVWVSEVMLQQTQVAVVIPYFLKWMERFPSIEKLAEASINEVLKLWEGLGYYSRARNLYEGARFVLSQYGGRIPSSAEELIKIKGLGPYTIGAIMSFAFRQKVAAVDGNVLRVMARYFMIEDDISKASSVKKIRKMVEEMLPEEEHWLVNEGLIELGATICGRTPNCLACPLRKTCRSYYHHMQHMFPKKSKKVAVESLYRCVAVIYSDEFVLLQKVKQGNIMADLCEFPYFEMDPAGISAEQATQRLLDSFGLHASYSRSLSSVNHSFTRYRAYLTPMLFSVAMRNQVESYHWHSIHELINLPFSSGHRRILEALLSNSP